MTPRTALPVLALLAGAVVLPPVGAASAAAPVASAATTRASDPLLALGDRGADVRHWQSVLNRAGDAQLAEDGVFGPATARATRALQARLGVAADGVVGPVTRGGASGLLDGTAQPAPVQDRLLSEGARGEDVRQWQEVVNALVAAGDVDTARPVEDGVYGPATRRATVDVQAALGVARDGVVGPVTRDGAAGLLDG